MSAQLFQLAVIILVCTIISACEQTPTSHSLSDSSVPASWDQQREVVMRSLGQYNTETSPLILNANADSNKVYLVEVSFATPFSGTVNVRYNPLELASSIAVTEDSSSKGLWFSPDTRKSMSEAYDSITVGPNEAHAIFLENLRNKNIMLESQSRIVMRLELLAGGEITQAPMWRISYIDMDSTTTFQALVDARTAQVINSSP